MAQPWLSEFQKASTKTAVEGVRREAMERGALAHLCSAPGGPCVKRKGIPLLLFTLDKSPRHSGEGEDGFSGLFSLFG